MISLSFGRSCTFYLGTFDISLTAFSKQKSSFIFQQNAIIQAIIVTALSKSFLMADSQHSPHKPVHHLVEVIRNNMCLCVCFHVWLQISKTGRLTGLNPIRCSISLLLLAHLVQPYAILSPSSRRTAVAEDNQDGGRIPRGRGQNVSEKHSTAI